MFDLELHEVNLRVPYEVAVGVVLKRGPKRLESKSEPVICKGVPKADFKDEKLSMLSTVYKDKATGALQERIVSQNWSW